MAAPGGPAAPPPPPPPPPLPPSSKSDQVVGDASASPPPPQETETAGQTPPPPPSPKSDQAVGDASASPPPLPETETAGPTPPSPPQNQTPAAETASPPQAELQRQTGTGEVADMSEITVITQAPSQETAAAAGAEDNLPAPPPPQPEEQKQGNTAKEGKDSATANSPREVEKKPGTSRWPRVRSPVLLLLSLFRLRRHGKQSLPIEQPKVSPSAPEDELAAQKEASEGSKRRRHEAEASSSPAGREEAPPSEPHQTKRRKSLQRTESVRPPEGVAAAGEADATPSPMKKKLQKAIVLVKKTLSWYGRHRSPENAEKPEEDQPAAQEDKGGDTKPSTSASSGGEEAETKSKQHDKTEEEKAKAKEEEKKATAKEKEDARLRLWARAEVRLEKILEDACTRLTLAEFMKLKLNKPPNDPTDKQQECLLTFSVFPLGSQVKKQAVTYWWCTRFNLSSEKDRGADETFSKLSAGGFLEPFKNRCSGVIYGCRVNPLVHWMVKHVAREKEYADLEEPGGPAFSQPKSDVLCLTAGNRGRMQLTKETPPNKEAVVEPSHSKKLHEDDDSKAQLKPNTTKEPSEGTIAVGHPSQKLHEDGDSQVQSKPNPTKEPSGGTTAVGHRMTQAQKLHEDGDLHAQLKPGPTKPPGGKAAVGRPSPKSCFCAPRPRDKQDKTDGDDETLEIAKLVSEFKTKKVILNINAHVYRLPELLLTQLGDGVEVLQLGRWGNTDDETYMEVESLDTLGAIGNLKNLRYLSVRGLSRLTELPREVRRLRRLAILDVRGCQNLVKLPSSTVKKLVGLTHLDLTECYMLEHIGGGVAALPELRVFKGFVFGVGKRRYDACRLQHLTKLKKLQKLSVNVTTDANVEKDEMKQLGKLAALLSLTVTWGEKPSILLHDSKKVQDQLEGLLNTWTGLRLPPKLEKLDVRCYPKDKLPLATWLNGNKELKKLYVRGGEVKDLEIPEDNTIETLRLRYLKKFNLEWGKLLTKFNRNIIKCVEVVDKDSKVTRAQTKGKDIVEVKVEKLESDGTKKEMTPIKKRMKIPPCTVDEHGVWVRDPKEEDIGDQTPGKAEAATGVAGKAEKGDDGASKAKKEVKEEEKPSILEGTHGENSAPSKDDNAATDDIKKVDSGDKNHETVNKESDNKREAKAEERDPIKNGAQVQESTVDENKMKVRDEELKEAVEKQPSPTLANDQTVAPVSEGDIKKGAVIDDKTDKDKISETKEERQDKPGDAKGQDEPPTKEDTGGDTDEPQTEGEDKGKDDEQPVDESGGDNGGDTSVGDATSSQASKTKEETTATLPPAAETSTSPTATPPALPPATTSAAPAVVDSTEPGKAGQEQAPTVENS